ncbi:MAG: protein kinase, partial [Planctomycetota bacterium]
AKELSLQSSTPPAKLAGYSIEQFVGAGACGEVWSGTEKKTGRRVAIKFYTRRNKDDVELLAREVEKLVALSADRYAVQLVDVDWTSDPPYFVIDYFEHGSLEDLLHKEKSLPVALAEDLFTEIARGLMHLHGKGIFHCDLKPGNVLLDEDNKPRLADFGQARLKTEKAPSLGTLFFMAPEQADLDAVPAAKWDVYALGAIFYCMLVGKPPYHSECLTERIESSTTVEERLKQYKKSLRSAETPTEHRDVPGVDRSLAEIIERMIDPSPGQRFDSVQSVLFALRQREVNKARRPLLVLGILGPLLLLVVMALFSRFAYRQAYENTRTAVRNQAIESNDFAAQLAAKSAGSKIEEYFRAVRELAENESFREDLQQAINDTWFMEHKRELDDPNNNGDPNYDELRADFINNRARMKLQSYLEKRIESRDSYYPEAASWFVNDIRGIQMASRFQTDPAINTIGRNYCYRTYFTGMNRDLKDSATGEVIFNVTDLGQDRPVIDRPHLSAIFRSRGTSTWKVAFSVPIWNVKGEELIGIVACTSEMGHFVEFQNGAHQYAILIDGRSGDSTGAILEHPVFHEVTINPEQIPSVDNLALIQESGRFEDPIAKLPIGDVYQKNWIAAVRPVLTNADYVNEKVGKPNSQNKFATDLHVLVAEDYDSVITPVAELSTSLIWLAIYATVLFVVVALVMWLLVIRMFKDTNSRLVRNFAAAGDSTYRTDLTKKSSR